VTENSRAMTAMLMGAVVGSVAGYLFFTERGRALRRQLEPALEDVARELNSFRATVRKAADVANEGWRVIGDALGEGDMSIRHPAPRQSSPF
jgi:gas vesicle protein